MKTNQPYPEEFKIEAVKQITERGHKVAEVSARIGVSQHSLYKWIKAYGVPAAERQATNSQARITSSSTACGACAKSCRFTRVASTRGRRSRRVRASMTTAGCSGSSSTHGWRVAACMGTAS